jgi:hypothetical protein
MKDGIQENVCLCSHLLEHIKLYFMYNRKMFAYAHIYLST